MVHGEGVRCGAKASKQRIASLPLATHTAHRHSELQAMYGRFQAEIEQLNERVLERAGERPTAGLLMTHPGVGPITAMATDVFLGESPKRFRDGKALASYIQDRENSRRRASVIAPSMHLPAKWMPPLSLELKR
jgi:transposase